ncbi:hypothetical protein CQW23_29592 [Capsicum baccatum]|uniref:Ceramide kinase n=1 Tax=Capsicum baccatum TaxID=33114 RepID=A0A2G2VJV1_CAPBA|nr:hypothetical protein CQW23_29592 [Capsicum baccatum]
MELQGISQRLLVLSFLYAGGDGFFNEILNGLLLSRHKCSYPPSPTELNHPIENNGSGLVLETNVDIRDPSDSGEDESPLLKQSTNLMYPECIRNYRNRRRFLPNSTTGARDAMTSALQIVLGKSVCLDIAQVVRWKKTSISKNEPSVHYAASFAGYGFYGDVITESKKYRWMGPKRYDYVGTKVSLSHRYGLWTTFVGTIFLLQLALFAILLTGHCLNEHPTDIAVHNEVFNL